MLNLLIIEQAPQDDGRLTRRYHQNAPLAAVKSWPAAQVSLRQRSITCLSALLLSMV
jgi:hypothetical protein